MIDTDASLLDSDKQPGLGLALENLSQEGCDLVMADLREREGALRS
jgi:hypothetical protein